MDGCMHICIYVCISSFMLNVTNKPYAECHYAECHYAECHYAECHYAECRGANLAKQKGVSKPFKNLLLFVKFQNWIDFKPFKIKKKFFVKTDQKIVQ